MNKEDFIKYMTRVVDLIELQDALDETLHFYNKSNERYYPSGIYMPNLVSDVLELLERIMDDKNEWISYWVYELDCGNKTWSDSAVIDAENNPISLKTIEDLWDILQNEVK